MAYPGELNETFSALADFTFAEVQWNDSGVQDLNITQLCSEFLSPKDPPKTSRRRPIFSKPLNPPPAFKIPQSIPQKREPTTFQGIGLTKSAWKNGNDHPLPPKIPKLNQNIFPHSSTSSQLSFEGTQLSFLGESDAPQENLNNSSESWIDDVIFPEEQGKDFFKKPSQTLAFTSQRNDSSVKKSSPFRKDDLPLNAFEIRPRRQTINHDTYTISQSSYQPSSQAQPKKVVNSTFRFVPKKPSKQKEILQSNRSICSYAVPKPIETQKAPTTRPEKRVEIFPGTFLYHQNEPQDTQKKRISLSQDSQRSETQFLGSQEVSSVIRRVHDTRKSPGISRNAKLSDTTEMVSLSQDSQRSGGGAQRRNFSGSQQDLSVMERVHDSRKFHGVSQKTEHQMISFSQESQPSRSFRQTLSNDLMQRSQETPRFSVSEDDPVVVSRVHERKTQVWPRKSDIQSSQEIGRQNLSQNIQVPRHNFTPFSDSQEDPSVLRRVHERSSQSRTSQPVLRLSQEIRNQMIPQSQNSQAPAPLHNLTSISDSAKRRSHEMKIQGTNFGSFQDISSPNILLSQGNQLSKAGSSRQMTPRSQEIPRSQDNPSRVQEPQNVSCKPKDNKLDQVLKQKSTRNLLPKNTEQMDWEDSMNESTQSISSSLQKYFESIGDEYTNDMLAFRTQVPERINETNTSVVSMDVEPPRVTSPELFTDTDDYEVDTAMENTLIVNTFYEYKDDEEKFMEIEKKLKNMNWKAEIEKMIENPEHEINFEETFDYLKWKYMKSQGKTRSIGKINDEIDVSDLDPQDVEILSQLSHVTCSQVQSDAYMPWNQSTESDEEEIRTAFEEERQNVKPLQWTPLSMDFQPGKNDEFLTKPAKPFHWTTPPSSPVSPPYRGFSQESPLSMVEDSQQTQLQVKPVKVKKSVKRPDPKGTLDGYARKIEALMVQLLEDLAAGKTPKLQMRSRKMENMDEDYGILSLKDDDDTVVRNISYSQTSMNMFDTVINLLSSIHTLLMTKTTCTKRELYYRNLELFPNQIAVNQALDHISCLLDAPLWQLGVMSTSKGLVAGNLTVIYESNSMSYTKVKTDIVPNNLSGIKNLQSSADFVLIVEKDTVFKRLLDNGIFEKLNVILITGKGFPDVNTRFLVKKIIEILKIPVYILVDADPHGIEIMLTYKFGSLNLAHLADELACPEIKWIGLKPSDAEDLRTITQDLTSDDMKKVNEMLQRRYITPSITQQLEVFKRTKRKAEIESLYTFSPNYLVREFIPTMIKISSVDDDEDLQ